MKKILSTTLPFLFLLPLQALAQLSGKVLDERGQPLAFASVYVRNSTNGTVANAEGEYRLTVANGTHEIVFQYIGYKQKIELVTIADKPVRLNTRMEPANLEIAEVVITTEDPAYRIMREVIAKRKYYKNKVREYSCDVYVKGFYKLQDAPKKILGKEIGNMGGILDTNRQGVIYLSESVSKVYAQAKPERKKEVMISSIVSGSDNGFSFNRATYTDFDLYDERIEIDREILSPLADNAFSYYNFKLLGKYRDENNYDIYKIGLSPKRSADPAFSGHLYVVDEWWNLAGADLALTGAAIKQPVLDTLRIQQEFVPVEKPDTWRLLSQVTGFKFGLLGFKFDGFFNGVFSNYDLRPQFPKNLFDKETFKIEDDANERDSTYWTTIRPIPLTLEESVDYVRKDSLQRIWKSDAYRDSVDAKNNKFDFSNLLFGYTWRNSKKHLTVSYPSLTDGFQFNTVQGWLVNFRPTFSKYDSEQRRRFWRAEGNVNYGFSEKTWRGGLRLERRFESKFYSNLELSGGLAAVQFSDKDPIGVGLNTFYSIFAKRNYMKLYEKGFAKAEYSRYLIPGLWLRADAEWANRRDLRNRSDYSTFNKNRVYTPNAPLTGTDEPFFAQHQAFTMQLTARIRIGETFSSYPKFRVYEGSGWPELLLLYRKAIAGVVGSDVNYDYVQAQIRRNGIGWGLFGYTDVNVAAGMFLTDNRLEFIDFHHPMGNQTLFGKPNNYTRAFFLLPYYDFATRRPFVQTHVQHHLQGWLLDKIPLLRKLHWKEVFGVGVYYTENTVNAELLPQRTPYWELNFGFENIGINFFRPFRIDVVAGFFGENHYKTGVVIGIGL
ncbi:MAG: carboxypeptidase-like regulatory domain-containing protein [Saprospiraceae bacterium]|nr:carboxypeptidase-like regulatory domain-containing protein [Saprospiraceae bacterium]